MSSAEGSKPQTVRVEQVAGEWCVTLDTDSTPYKVVAWNPPRLVLEHAGTLRELFVTRNDVNAWIGGDGQVRIARRPQRRSQAAAGASPVGELTSPMPGKVLQVRVAEGDRVKLGDRLVIVEAMKMENPIRAPHDGVVKKIHVSEGQSVTPGEPIIELEETDPEDNASGS